MYKVVVVGAVKGTEITINSLVKHGFEIAAIFGHEPKIKENIAGLFDLSEVAIKNNIPYLGFQNINSIEIVEKVKELKPDIVFAVGFSQLLKNEWLTIPKLGCIGFHPTNLPLGRGRAPIAWLVLNETKGAACFFLMGNGADDGPIFAKEVFDITENDNANSVAKKISIAMEKALDSWLPELKSGIWNPVPQDEINASYYGIRKPDDGIIDWKESSFIIAKLIKASSKPHPGAYFYFQNEKVIVWDCELENTLKIKGVNGRVLLINEEKGYLIQCGIGLIWIRTLKFEKESLIKVGDYLGFKVEDEIQKLWKKINLLEKNI
jgi:methionyl-tRNA formyltransferase